MIHWLADGSAYLLHERAARFAGEGVGWLSIKSFHGGEASYRVDRARYLVDNQRYLVLANGQHYAIEIESSQPVESFCVFFAPAFAESVYQSIAHTHAENLDRCERHAPTFFARTYRHDATISPLLAQLRAQSAAQRFNSNQLTEQLHTLMQHLFAAHSATRYEAETLAAVRAATREELYRRLHQARDYVDALYNTPLTVNAMADIAGLSLNHFLRSFKQAFGQTPHQYLTAVRLDRARLLLRTTSLPITTICFAVGFESPGAFSWLFRKRIGCSPIQYRQQFR